MKKQICVWMVMYRNVDQEWILSADVPYRFNRYGKARAALDKHKPRWRGTYRIIRFDAEVPR